VAGDPAEASDVSGGPTILTSPVFDLSGRNGLVTFYAWLYCSNGNDYLYAQVSNNNGQTWVSVKTLASGDFLPYGAGGNRQWMRFDFVVGDFVATTNQMRIRFSIADNPHNSVTDAGIDTVDIVRFGGTTLGPVHGRAGSGDCHSQPPGRPAGEESGSSSRSGSQARRDPPH
jgi:hypothetical protein